MINPGNADYVATYNEIQEVLEVMEQLYDSWLATLEEKKTNIKRVNLNAIAELITIQKAKGEINGRKDIIRFIDGIICD